MKDSKAQPTTTSLFNELAEQEKPSVIRDGRFILDDCPLCRGSGRRRYSAYSAGYTAERFSERCGACGGGGKRLAFSSQP